ncbi:hypothetical protein ACTHOQ_04245 [Solibacillus silvestris]|uniref:hypothetical protein n=1 Tax=Solibacillus silvestris TaxID=76853 RepID=UPI003F7EAEB3
MAPNFVAKSLERQHLKSMRKHSLQIIDINTVLKDLHHRIASCIDAGKYEAATTYVNQYISHTHIWHIKFVCNLEEPEVALMQIFHLQYIFRQEPADKFIKEREILEEQYGKFRAITLYSNKHMEVRRQKMAQFIKEYKK